MLKNQSSNVAVAGQDSSQHHKTKDDYLEKIFSSFNQITQGEKLQNEL